MPTVISTFEQRKHWALEYIRRAKETFLGDYELYSCLVDTDQGNVVMIYRVEQRTPAGVTLFVSAYHWRPRYPYPTYFAENNVIGKDVADALATKLIHWGFV